MTPDAMTAPSAWPPAEPLALTTKYEPDPFQKHAILGIHGGDHVFVTAKTGSGKTFVGEYLIARELAAGNRVIFTTPIKALSNQKYHDLKKLLGPSVSVGLLTGDIKMCPDASVIVMTAEILCNLLHKEGSVTEGVGRTAAISLTGVTGVVMDEAHYIQDPDRGHVWEETLILLAGKPIQVVLLSATMPSATSLAGWLANLHQRRTWLLSTTYRIVPLVHGLLEPATEEEGGWRVRPVLDTAGHWIPEAYGGWLRNKKAIVDAALNHKKAVEARKKDGFAAPPPSGKVRVEDPVARLTRTVKWLEVTRQLPALFFVFSRRECERMAALVPGSLLDSSESAAATHIIDFHLSRHRAILETSPVYHTIHDLLSRGVAFHHSGLHPLLKEMVELLFTRGFVKVLFATETFSVGLNMPTKTVVFLELEKWTDGGVRRLLRPDEYIQMAGRAGRRGLDTRGLVLYEPFRDPIEMSDLKSLLTGALPALSSRMRFHYDFILKHRLRPSSAKIAEQSYWALQQKESRVALESEIVAATAALEKLEATVSESDQALTAEHEEMTTALTIKKNAAYKKAKAALDAWIAEQGAQRLAAIKERVDVVMSAKKKKDRLVATAVTWDAAPLLALEPQDACLTAWGFLEGSSNASSSAAHPIHSLTLRGTLATEINEGHPILMSLLAESGRTADLTAEEIACILAAFLQEGSNDRGPSLKDSDLRPEALDVLYWVDAQSIECQRDEEHHGVTSPSGYWSLSALWVCVAARWLAGDGLTEIAAAFDLFEGNVQRGLMRIANLLEEWVSVATLRTDLATLEKLRSLNFLRDDLIVDSLYLRL
jgi:superfamily II RNA helicase